MKKNRNNKENEGNSIVYRNSKWWGSIIWSYGCFQNGGKSPYGGGPPYGGPPPVRVQTGKWKVVKINRGNQKVGFHHRGNVNMQHFTICKNLIFFLTPSQLGIFPAKSA